MYKRQALEYMRENPDYENYGYNCTGAIEKDGVTIRCYNGHVHGQVGFQDSLAYSCNTSFSNIGLSLDIKNFRETSKELLFNSKLPSVLPYSKSSFSLEPGAGSADKMMTAMGQGKTQVSPYHICLLYTSSTEALKAVRQVDITENMEVEEVLKQALKLMMF